MPLFALVSGYFSVGSIARRGARQIIRAAVHLLTPCLTVVLIANARVIYHYFKTASNLDLSFTSPFFLLWFLICIFECSVFMCILMSRTSWWWRSFWCVFPIVLAVYTWVIPLASDFAFLYPFYLVGAYLYSKGWKGESIWGFFLSIVVFTGVFIIFKPSYYVYCSPLNCYHHDWESWLTASIRFAGGLSGSLCFLYLVRWLRFLGKVKVIQDMGKFSLAIYVLQGIFIEYVWIIHFQTVRMNLPLCMVGAVLLLFLLYGCTLLINKSRVLKFLFLGETK